MMGASAKDGGKLIALKKTSTQNMLPKFKRFIRS